MGFKASIAVRMLLLCGRCHVTDHLLVDGSHTKLLRGRRQSSLERLGVADELSPIPAVFAGINVPLDLVAQRFRAVQDYTHVVMNFLLTGRVGPDRNEDWLEYFDVVITGDGFSPHPWKTLFIVRGPLLQRLCLQRVFGHCPVPAVTASPTQKWLWQAFRQFTIPLLAKCWMCFSACDPCQSEEPTPQPCSCS